MKQYFLRLVMLICFLFFNVKALAVDPYYVASIPKSGTYLLNKVFTEISSLGIPYKKSMFHLFHLFDRRLEPFEENTRKIVIIRDLRDVLVSAVNFYGDTSVPTNSFFKARTDLVEKWKSANFDTKLSMIISGKSPPLAHMYRTCLNVLNNYENFDSELLIIHFEDLVGKQGGGSREKQIEAIDKIARFIGAHLSYTELEHVADHLFGGTYTFRKGKIGAWKTYFKSAHKSEFKEKFPEYLIKYGYEVDNDW